MHHQREPIRLLRLSRRLGDLLAGKAQAYGAAHQIQPDLWPHLLERYRISDSEILARQGNVLRAAIDRTLAGEPVAEEPYYLLPASLVRQIPRLTRVLDRVLRITGGPAGDVEEPWLDMAGDALAGYSAYSGVPTPPGNGPVDREVRAAVTTPPAQRPTSLTGDGVVQRTNQDAADVDPIEDLEWLPPADRKEAPRGEG